MSVLMSISVLQVSAQVLDQYVFSTGTDASKWIPLTTTTNICSSGDNGKSAVLDLGFSFAFGEDLYTQFSLNADGNVRLGSTQTGTSNYTTPFNSTNASANAPKINFLGCDGFLSDSGYVYYQVVGEAPNRIGVIEYATSTYNNTSRSAILRWQVQLFEGSNNIQIVYGPTTPVILPAVARQVGLAIDGTDLILVNQQHQATHYTVGQSVTIPTSTWPDVNRYYLFEAPVISCLRPTSVTASDITTHSINVSWPGSANEYIVEYGPSGFTLGYGTQEQVFDTTLLVENLTAGTAYDFYVRAICAAGDSSSYSDVTTISTDCDIIRTLPYTQNFDAFEGSTSTTVNNLSQYCWNYLNTGTTYTGYPIAYKSSTYSQSGENSLRFYVYTSSTYGDQIAIMPAIDVATYPMNTLQVEFSANKYSTYSLTMQVGIMTDSSDASTFFPIDTIVIPTTETANAYSDYIVSFEQYQGNGRFIAFKVEGPSTTTYTAGCVDDIIVSQIPNCKKPMDVTLSQISDNSVTVDWTSMGDESSWEISIVTAGAPIDEYNIYFTSEHPYTISGLTDQTSYDVYVRSNCGAEVSPWTTASTFTTRCSATSTIPYSENFDSYPATTTIASGVIPTCWNRSTNYTSQYPYIYSTYHASGTGSLYFYGTSTYYSLATSQALDLSQYAAGGLTLSFKAMRTSSTSGYGRIRVGLMTDADDISTFTVLKDLNTNDYSGTSVWDEFNVIIPSSYSDPVYLAFYVPNEVTSYVYIDDVVLDVTPDCTSPRNISVSGIHGVNAQVNWEEAFIGADGYYVEYSEAGMENWSSPAFVNGTSYILTELNPLTKYDVRVSSNCMSGYADPVQTTFSTVCLLPDDIAIGSGTSTSYYVPFYTAYQYSYSQQLFTSVELNNEAKDIATISFQYNGSSSVTKNIDIYLLNTASTTVSSWVPTTNAQLVYSGLVTMQSDASNDDWNTIVLDSIFHYDGYSNLLMAIYSHNDVSSGSSGTDKTFKSHSKTNMARYLYNTTTTTYNPLDVTTLAAGTAYSYRNNVRFGNCNTSTTCVPPTLSVESVSDEDITVSWIPGYQENSWELEYKLNEVQNWTSLGIVTESPYVIANLAENTVYQIRLRAICSDTSEWSTVTAQTVCHPVGLPLIQGFEDATGSGSAHFVPCWTRGTDYTTTYPYTSSTSSYIHDGSYALYFYTPANKYEYAASPILEDGVRMDSLQIRFWAKKSSASYFIEVGVMTNPNDYNTFELLGRLTPDTVSTWQELEITTENYTGTGRSIAFRQCGSSSSNYMYVDDITIQYIPNCQRVSDVHAENMGIHSADIVFTSNPEASMWNYIYGEAGTFAIDTMMPVSTPDTIISLTNLDANTTYDIFIQTECSNGEFSEYVQYTFTTNCDVVTAMPFIDNFDNYGGSGSAYYPSCWTRYYASSATSVVSTSYPYVYSTNTNTPPGCLYFYNLSSTAGTYSMAILPEFASSIAINSLQIDLNIRTSSTSNYLLVGVVTDPSDPSTFTIVDTLSNSVTSTYEPFTVLMSSYTGTGKHIAFKGFGYVYMDDLMIDYAPACDAPTDFSVDNIAQTTASVSWNAGGQETSWEVYVVESGSSVVGAIPMIVNDSTANLSNLQPGTVYDIYIRAICPGGTGHSGYLVSSITTMCYGLTTLPFTENFDACTGSTTGYVNNLPSCWNNLSVGHSSTSSYAGYPIIYSTSSYAQSPSNSLRFYSGTAAAYGDQYAILPAIDETLYPVNTLQLAFDARKYSSTYSKLMLEVGVITAYDSASTFVPVDTVYVEDLEYNHFVVYFNQYQGLNGRICIKAPKQNGTDALNGGNLDNIEVSLAPSCFRVDNPVVTYVTQNTATLQWDVNGNETSWNVEYKPSYDTTWTLENTSNNPTTIYSLQSGTTYDFRVQADCGSEYSNVVSATTDCEDLSTLPYTENFDSYTASTSGTTANLPFCWHQLNLGATSSTYRGYPIMYNSTTYSLSGTNSLRFYSYRSGSTSYGDQWAIASGIDTNALPIQDLQLKFKARKYSASYPFDLVIGVMSDYRDTATFVPVSTVSPTSTEYENFTVYFNNYPGGGKYIAMMTQTPGSSYNAGFVEDIELSLAPSCIPVSDLATTMVTSNSIALSWTPNGDETNWIVEYLPEGDTIWNQEYVSSTPSLTIQNLNPNTSYLIRVQADCMDQLSTMSNVLIATTACSAMSLPFAENFDNMTGSTTGTVNNLPDCWNNLSGTYSSYAGYPIVYNSSTYAASGNNSIRFYTYTGTTDYGDQYAIFPPIDENVNPINTLQLTFKSRRYTSTYATFTLIVGVMSDASNAATFVPVDTIVETSLTYVEHTVMFNNYTGNGNRVVIMAPKQSAATYNEGHVDDILLEPIGACPKPQDLTATNKTTTTVTLSWDEVGDATQWNVMYGPVDTTQGPTQTVVANTNPFTVTGLNPSTNYTFAVQSYCGNNEYSAWSNPFVTATECDVIALPYTENFDSYAGTNYSTAGVAPTCWTTITNNTSYPAPHVVGSGSSYYYYHSPSNSLIFTAGSAGNDAYAVLPTFDRALNTMTLSFWRAMESVTYGTLTVGYVTSTANIATSFVPVMTIPSVVHSGTGGGDTISVDFTGADIPANGNIAFHWNHTASFYSCCIDDICVTSSDTSTTPDITTCDAPVNVNAVNVTENAATITWTPVGTETAWNLQYKLNTAADWGSSINVTAPTYDLTGLTANTTYQVRVQAVCDADNTSDWSALASFTTEEEVVVEPCDAPSNLTVYDIHNHDVTLTWQENGTATSWTIYYRIHGASSWMTQTVNTNTYTLTGLEGYTEYDYQVVSNCADGATSDPSNSVTERTTNVGIEDYDAAAISVFPNPTTGMVQVSSSKFQVSGVDVYDVYGKLLKTDAMMDNSTVDMSGYAAGVYFLRVSTENGVVTKRVVKR